MEIEIQLFATLTAYLPPGADGRRVSLTVAEGITVAEVLDQLGVPLALTKLIFVNSVHGTPDTVLKAGTVLCVFPPLAGG